MAKGITIIGLIFGFFVVLMYFVMLPAIEEVINTISPSLDPTTNLVISLFPVMMFMIIMVGIWYTGQGSEQVA